MAKITAYRPVKTLGEHRQAFLNFYNRRSWVYEEANYDPANMLELVMAAINHGPMTREEFLDYSLKMRDLLNRQNYYKASDLLASLMGYKNYRHINKEVWSVNQYVKPLLSIKEAIAFMQHVDIADYRHRWVKVKKGREHALFKTTINRYADLQADIRRARQVRFGSEPIQWRHHVRREFIEMILNERFPAFAKSQQKDLKRQVLDIAFNMVSRFTIMSRNIIKDSQHMRRIGKQAKEIEGYNYFPSLNAVYCALASMVGYPNYGEFIAYNDRAKLKDNKGKRKFVATHMTWLYNLNYRIYSVSWERVTMAEYRTRMHNKESQT